MMQKRRISASPTAIQILLTRECNLACDYCSAAQFDTKETEPELTTGEWLNVLARLKEIQVFQVDFSGGEMFLRKDIFDILESAVKCKFPKMTIITNGTLITEKSAKNLKALNIKKVSVSLDGDADAHDRVRGTGSFDRAMKGINHLVNNGILPEILFTPLKSNYKTLAVLIEKIYTLGIKKISFNILHPTGKSRNKYKDIRLDCFVDAAEFQKIVKTIREKYKDFRIADLPLVYQSLPHMYADERDLLNAGGKKFLKPCSAGHTSCNITASGWVIPCSELFDFKGGNIKEQDILDIWKNSENFEKIRQLSDISSDQIPYCRNCNYNIFCSAGCRADSYEVFGDLMAPDPFCPYWKNMKDKNV